MQWEERLFDFLDDLESAAGAAYEAEREAELWDRARAEYASVTLEARLHASLDRDLVLTVAGVGRVAGNLRRAGAGWLLLGAQHGEWLVLTAAVRSVSGASDRAVPEIARGALGRLPIASALRRLGDAGERVVVHLVDGARPEGTVARVGADFFELRSSSGEELLLAHAGLAAVQGPEV